MDNYTAAVRKMNSVGLAKMYEELHEKTGAMLEFEDMDLAKSLALEGRKNERNEIR